MRAAKMENIPDDNFFQLAKKMSLLDNETVRRRIIELETFIDGNLRTDKISQQDAWDAYFGLLHECDERNLLDDRVRLLKKIDTKCYNPFQSKNPAVVMIARIRLQARSSQN